MSYTLDSAHEALAVIVWHCENDYAEDAPGYEDALAALEALEAQLPDPCAHCGSDQCRLVRWPSSEGPSIRACRFPGICLRMTSD